MCTTDGRRGRGRPPVPLAMRVEMRTVLRRTVSLSLTRHKSPIRFDAPGTVAAHKRAGRAHHASRHQRHGPHRPPGAARGDGRRRAAFRRPARRQPPGGRAPQRAKGGAAATAHLLAFDSVQGRWRADIAAEGEDAVRIDGRALTFSSHATAGRDPLGRPGRGPGAGVHRQVPHARDPAGPPGPRRQARHRGRAGEGRRRAEHRGRHQRRTSTTRPCTASSPPRRAPPTAWRRW